MRQPEYSDQWPESWRHAYNTDSAEFWGLRVNVGYTYAYQRRFSQMVAMVERNLAPGSTILDLAAGQGNFTLRLAEAGYEVTWNDLREELGRYVELKRERGVVHYLPGNAFEINDVGPFDAVLATEIIEHVAHPDQFLSQLRVLCRPGGLVFLSTPNGSYVRNKLPTFVEIEDFEALEAEQFKPGSEGHLFLFTNEELVTLARIAGLSLVELANFTTPVLSGDVGRLGHGLRYLPAGPVHAVNKVAERLSRRLSMNTALVLRRPLT